MHVTRSCKALLVVSHPFWAAFRVLSLGIFSMLFYHLSALDSIAVAWRPVHQLVNNHQTETNAEIRIHQLVGFSVFYCLLEFLRIT